MFLLHHKVPEYEGIEGLRAVFLVDLRYEILCILYSSSSVYGAMAELQL